jgi:hypothetical protein
MAAARAATSGPLEAMPLPLFIIPPHSRASFLAPQRLGIPLRRSRSCTNRLTLARESPFHNGPNGLLVVQIS